MAYGNHWTNIEVNNNWYYIFINGSRKKSFFLVAKVTKRGGVGWVKCRAESRFTFDFTLVGLGLRLKYKARLIRSLLTSFSLTAQNILLKEYK